MNALCYRSLSLLFLWHFPRGKLLTCRSFQKEMIIYSYGLLRLLRNILGCLFNSSLSVICSLTLVKPPFRPIKLRRITTKTLRRSANEQVDYVFLGYTTATNNI
uniref:Uncharacterized protein n=1 Tax=Anopheles darlingi TaxID=43151 RepID=A0A2M4D9P6_ANODA